MMLIKLQAVWWPSQPAVSLHLRLLTVLSRSLPMDAVASPPLPAPVKDASFATSQPVVPLSTQAASQALSTAPSSYSWAIRLAGDHG